MTPTWTDETPAPPLGRPQGLGDWLRVLRRGVPILVLLGLGLALLLLVRLVEWPLFGARRPVSPYITVVVCRGVLRLLGLATRLQGAPMRHHGAFVANHASWLDIFVLNAARDVYFVSKAEVAGWPGIGLLARATGTVFIARDRREARAQTELFRTRLMGRHHLLFFPEGTSTDSRRVLPFKPTLFAACFDPALRDALHVQPVTLVYHAPAGTDPRFYGWWGEMGFGAHMLAMLVARRHGSAEVIFHPPLKVADFADRKALARTLEETVRAAHHSALRG
ncbi:MAG: lysophospholipid acyltransferase family protein [Marinovum algicola]|jgi:1-acyl-sn-glycerol-3-phosphate acyltransferase|uniref:Lyso-ornithine lipid acyltransferase n=1 Tax=Marinovum algicola TaxID=42444 RepID=A0A975ZMG2_9RHOB|nr:lysophospholipid acyltransferase family protein [Marinovum algicola]SEJ05063.1 lyso-ornithine lipid acyltransferase [Marinovum algicola]SLN18829.1 2-acyl-glycerophospho-ethanolamine acyltransferase [Marinovum algicola]